MNGAIGPFGVERQSGGPRKPKKRDLRNRKAEDYLGSLDGISKYSDDGFTLSTPLRYSTKDWWNQVLSMPRSLILRRIRQHVLFNVFWSMLVSVVYSSLPRQSMQLASIKCASASFGESLVPRCPGASESTRALVGRPSI